jgi:hypothetical protein
MFSSQLKLIHNFPERYPKWMRVYSNVITWVGHTHIRTGENWLTTKDFHHMKKNLKVGDLILVGSLRTMSSLIITGPLTHSLLYLGKNRCIHSVGDGVSTISLSDMFKKYDTLSVLRYRDGSRFLKREQFEEMSVYAYSKIGTPYDFTFGGEEDCFTCAAFIKASFEHAGLKVELPDEQAYLGVQTIHPMDFIQGPFYVVSSSHNLIHENGKIQLLDSFRNRLREIRNRVRTQLISDREAS